MALENKSLTELRGIAQAVGINLDWGWDRIKLIDKINKRTVTPMIFPKENQAAPDPIPTTLEEALASFKALGLVVTFPDQHTIRMTRTVGKITKDDSCRADLPLRTIIQCAAALMKG